MRVGFAGYSFCDYFGNVECVNERDGSCGFLRLSMTGHRGEVRPGLAAS
jgi:hypothetical protein